MIEIAVFTSPESPDSGVTEVVRAYPGEDWQVREFVFTDNRGDQIIVRLFGASPKWESA
jgi:hypothetical protein